MSERQPSERIQHHQRRTLQAAANLLPIFLFFLEIRANRVISPPETLIFSRHLNEIVDHKFGTASTHTDNSISHSNFPNSPFNHLRLATMPSSSRIPVALLGLGGVGVAILKQLTSAPLASKFELQLIANSKRCLVASKSSSGGGPIDDVSSALDRLNQDGQSMQLDQVISLIGSGGIFVDSTASDDVAATYPSLLRRGVHVVTPNKKAASSSLSLWKDILDAQAQPGAGKYYGESTVGAGLPILSTLTDLVETGDEIHKVEGVFSGTLSYIFNEFAPVPSASAAHDGSEKSVPFSDVVKVAKEQGYTVSEGGHAAMDVIQEDLFH